MKIKKVDANSILLSIDKKKVTVNHDADGFIQAYGMNKDKNITVDTAGEFEYDSLSYVAIEIPKGGVYSSKVNLVSIGGDSSINLVFYFSSQKPTKEDLENVPTASVLVTDITDSKLLQDVSRMSGAEMVLVVAEKPTEDDIKKLKAAFAGLQTLEGGELEVNEKDFESEEDTQMAVYVIT